MPQRAEVAMWPRPKPDVAVIESDVILSDEKFNELVLEHSQKRMTEEAAEGLNSFLEKRTASWYQK